MNRSEAATLLALAAARDRRTIGDVDVLAWAEDLADVGFEEARQALGRHFRESEDWLMPVHIRAHVKRIREERHRRRRSQALALPSRYESDVDRAARIRAGVEACRAALTRPAQEESAPQ